ncbi:MAG: cation-transporting P-type ATPase, partial [Chloroflexi bacterium]|nr:cation-transporting P-type ATPase [Chloroflexota bacterium]
QARLLLAGAALCSNARLEQRNGAGGWQVVGDPTEGALLVAAQKAGVGSNQIGAMAPRIHELPFDSRRKMMSVLLRWSVPDLLPNPQSYVVFTKGAPLEVLRRSRHLLADGQLRCLSESDRAEVVAANDTFAGLGLRVLGIGFRTGGAELADGVPALLEQELTFVGLVAMLDPARPEVEGAIRQCRGAGISVTMITGDYGLTAEAIARRIGLVTEAATIVKGDDLDTLSEESLRDLLVGSDTKSGLIFARVMPEQKLRLVQAYQGLGHVVAVTGDGVNDAPALRAANIGLAMGGSGTDVAREAAEIVLTDDNFATIVRAVEQGRAVYDNIRKFLTYILASNVPEIVPFLAMVAFGIPPALTILQILAVDLGTDMIPAMALGAEPPEQGVMERPPRPKDQPLLDVPLLLRAYAFLGVIEAVASMIAFLSVWQGYGYSFADLQSVTPAILARTADAATMLHYQQATTMALAAIVACQIGNVFACRAEVGSILGRGLFSNRLIWIGVVTEISLLLAVVHLPPLQRVFDTAALTPLQWLSLLVWPPLLVAAEELRKLVVRRWQRASR